MTSENKIYLQFGGAFCGGGPMLTVEAEFKQTELPLWGRSATGYGRRIPTSYMVKHNGKWRRVYVCCYGNSGTAYIGSSAEPIATVDGPY